VFNQINIKTRNTCQEADKVTSNLSIKRKMQRQPRYCFDKCIDNYCNNAWIINSFYFEYRSPIRSNPTTTQLYQSDPIRNVYFCSEFRTSPIGSDSDRICTYTDTDTDISQHTPYQGFSVTGYIMNR
jgi:hypothetical protein